MNSTFKENSNKVHAKPSRGLEYRLTGNGTYTVSGIGTCKDTDIVIPKTHNGRPVTTIGDHTFFNYKNLISIVIPDSITEIENFAFRGCSNLTSVTIPDSITNISSYAFLNCKNLISIAIPNSVTMIDVGTFWGCSSLASITIPDSVISIGHRAFFDCNKLQKLGSWKATDANIMCGNHKFSLGKWNKKLEAKLCKKGFHFCENAFDLFNYYDGKIGKDVRFFEVETEDVSDEKEDDSERVCKKIKLVREIKSYAELLN